MKKINILGINLTALRKAEVTEKISEFLSGKNQRYLVTVNPEFILEAQQDEEFFYILNKADLAVVDGMGLKLAALSLGKWLPRITGADLVRDILGLAEKEGRKVAILNWRGGMSRRQDLAASLKALYPGLHFEVYDIDRRGELVDLESLNRFGPQILLASLGAPWQEKVIYHNLSWIPSLRLAMGVGGALDFLTGKVRRAPKLLRFLGLEWLWRLARQPNRAGRIWRAVAVFPWRFFVWRFIQPFFYRDNVACLLYKKEDGKYKILIVERSGQGGHWQLPQGGTEGESIEKAGARELREELGTEKFRPVASFESLWHYRFKKSDPRRPVKRHQGYKGQRQGLYIAEFLGGDSDIKINYWDHQNWRWVKPEELVKSVYRDRQAVTIIFLQKFLSVTEGNNHITHNT